MLEMNYSKTWNAKSSQRWRCRDRAKNLLGGQGRTSRTKYGETQIFRITNQTMRAKRNCQINSLY